MSMTSTLVRLSRPRLPGLGLASRPGSAFGLVIKEGGSMTGSVTSLAFEPRQSDKGPRAADVNPG